MLFILSVVLLFVFIMLICFLSLLVVIKIVPVVSLIIANGVLGFWIVSVGLLNLALLEFYLNKKKGKPISKKTYVEGFMGALYIVLMILLGQNISKELLSEEIYHWEDGEIYSLKSFDDVKEKYLREVDSGYEIMIEKQDSHVEIQKFEFKQVVIYERDEQKPCVKLIEGKSLTNFEKIIMKYGMFNDKDKRLGTKIRIEIYLPIMTDSYFL